MASEVQQALCLAVLARFEAHPVVQVQVVQQPLVRPVLEV